LGALGIISGLTAGHPCSGLRICGPTGVGRSTVSWRVTICLLCASAGDIAEYRPGSCGHRRGRSGPSAAEGPQPGLASGVYLFPWNRSDAAQAGVTVSGDTRLLDLWRSSVRVRWG
jgi:hypothetical protein